MALIQIEPYVIDVTENFTFNNVTATGNLLSLNANLGNVAVANFFTGTLTTASQPNITSVGTLGNLTVTSNVTAGNIKTDNLLYANGTAYVFTTNAAGSNTQIQFNNANAFAGSANLTFNNTTNTLSVTNIVANGSGLTSLTGANVTGAVAYATTANSVAGGNVSGQVANSLIAGTVYTNAQPNITSVGTLTSLSAGDTTITGNLTVSGSFEYANVTSFRVKDPIIEQGGDTTGTALTSNDGYDRGQLLHYYSGSTAVDAFMGWDNSNAEFAFGSNVTISSEVATFNSFGNVRASFFIGNGSALTGVSATSSTKTANGTSNVDIATANGNITMGVAGNASIVTITGTGVNIAGYANLGNGILTTTGNVAFSGANVTLGQASNLHIAGGTAGYFLTTDGTGNLSWGSAFGGGGVTASGSNTYIQFNDGGVLGSSANLAFDKGTKILTVDRAIHINGANLGSNVSNVYIGGGTANQVLKTDGSGNLSWATVQASQTSGSTTVDVFTGDGTTTAFTLTVAPTNINQTVVNYNGALQLRSAYTVSGTTITFSSAPASGSILEVTTTIFDTNGGASTAFITRSYTGTGSQTAFTVTSGCTVTNVMVTENGLVQAPTTDYTISGTTLTFTTAPGNGVNVQIRELSVAVATVSASASMTWNIASSNATMTANNGYFVDTSGGAKTMTLPASATLGDTIRINDLAGSFATNNLTVARNGLKIQGSTDDLLIDVNQSSFGLVYSNSTYGWKLMEM